MLRTNFYKTFKIFYFNEFSTALLTQKAKAKFTAAVTQLFPPSDNTGMPGTTQTLEPSVENPPGQG